MNNQEIKLQEQTKSLVQTNLQPIPQKSSWQVKKSSRLVLRLNPTAYAKLLYFREKSDNEIGGFAITEPDDLLLVKEFITVKQEVTSVSVKFDDSAVADFFDAQVDIGRKPEQFARIWLHTHPGDFCEPSIIDEETFLRVFGSCQWAVMFILAQNNKTFSRLRFNVGPGGQILIPAEVDYSQDFGPSNHKLWDDEYQENITVGTWLSQIGDNATIGNTIDKDITPKTDISSLAMPYDFIDELEKMEPAERQFILDELADRPDLWDEEEVMYL